MRPGDRRPNFPVAPIGSIGRELSPRQIVDHSGPRSWQRLKPPDDPHQRLNVHATIDNDPPPVVGQNLNPARLGLPCRLRSIQPNHRRYESIDTPKLIDSHTDSQLQPGKIRKAAYAECVRQFC